MSKRTTAGRILQAIAVVAIAAAIWFTLHRSDPPAIPAAAAKPEWNLVMISIDTVRTDDLQVYNPAGVPTPGLNRVASAGMTFTHAISQVPYTLPSHITLLTGTYPMYHRVEENTRSRLPDSAVTLAEILHSSGYTTAAFVGSVVLSRSTGINQGFDVFDDTFDLSELRMISFSGIQRPAGRVYDVFHHWHVGVTGKYFAFLHFYDPHAPYDPPARFRSADTSPRGLYRGELSYVDSVIEKVLPELNLRDTMVVITGDHGEMFGEHGESGHGYFVYQPAVNVPMIIAYPNQPAPGSRTAGVVSLVDVCPTLLDLLGLPVPKEVQGSSFANLVRNQETPERLAYSESLTPLRCFQAMPIHSVQDARFKYIAGPQPELYDLANDPREAKNLVSQEASTASRMKAETDEYLRKFSSAANTQQARLPPEQQEQLAALGYISPSQDAAPNPSRDAKQFIQSWSDLNRLHGVTRSDPQEALVLVGKLRAAGVDSVQIRIFEARALTLAGRTAEAVRILQTLLEKDPDDPSPLASLAQAYEAGHDFRRAAQYYEKAAETQPSPPKLQNYAKNMLRMKMEKELLAYMIRKEAAGALTPAYDQAVGEIYYRLNQYERAETRLRSAISGDPSSRACIMLSNILENRGDRPGALTLMESEQARFEDANFLFRLGALYNAAGQQDKERIVLQRALASHPDDPRGYFYMARNFIFSGADPRRVLDLAQKGMRLHPDPEFESFGNSLLARAYKDLGQNDLARTYLERAKQR